MDSFNIFAADNKDISKEDLETYVKDKTKELSHNPEKLEAILDEFSHYAEEETGMSKETVEFAVNSARNMCFESGEVVPRDADKPLSPVLCSMILWFIIFWADQRKAKENKV